MAGQTQSGGEGQQITEMYAVRMYFAGHTLMYAHCFHQSIYKDLGHTTDRFASSPSIVSVILLVHSWLKSSSLPQISVLSSFTPSLIVMLQPTSNLQDDALAFLLLILHQNQITSKIETSPDTINSLMPQLIVLSSVHPSPLTRHHAFRILSLLLASGPPQLRLQHLADLVAKCEYPQMRVAAVGLVKDAVLEALNTKSGSGQNTFGSPMFMRVFGPLLFRPSPPDLFDQGAKLNLEEFLESPEPKRVTEVLSLYYVILLRDEGNSVSLSSGSYLCIR